MSSEQAGVTLILAVLMGLLGITRGRTVVITIRGLSQLHNDEYRSKVSPDRIGPII